MSDADNIRKLVGDLTNQPPTKIMLDSWPTQYGLDSLSILIFREQCENMFGFVIPDDDWAGMHKLRDILTFIGSSRLKGKKYTFNANSIEASPASAATRWGSDYFVEALEIGMPLTGINHLSENALLKYLGDLRWRNMMCASGVSSRELVDASNNRLYPTFFYVESSFPADRPMAYYCENDVFEVADSVRRYGHSMLDGVAYLVPPEKRDQIAGPLEGLEDAASTGIPAVRMSNIFVMMFDGAEWLKKGRPRSGLIDGIRELPVAPDSFAIAKQAEKDGYVEFPDESYLPLHDTPAEYDYAVQADRDVNGAGLLYFANYPLFLDLAERDALHMGRCAWPDELINKRTIIGRKIAYLNNASWKDVLKIKTQSWIKKPLPSSYADLAVVPIYIFTNQQMYRGSDGRLMCVSSARKMIYGVGADRLEWGSHFGRAK
jgi:probable biosynthetic protein (TIGR04098 family)